VRAGSEVGADGPHGAARASRRAGRRASRRSRRVSSAVGASSTDSFIAKCISKSMYLGKLQHFVVWIGWSSF
jgi:hypothetical protein